MAKRRAVIRSLADINKYKKYFINWQELEIDSIRTLANIGGKIIKRAYASRSFQNRTKNLKDSYVSAVFNNGVLVKGTVRYVGPPESTLAREFGETASGDAYYESGREAADRFLAKWGFSAGRPGGIVLVVAAAMFYSGILESIKGGGYRVISHIRGDLEEVQRKGFTTMKYTAHISPSDLEGFEPFILKELGSRGTSIVNM